MMVHENTWDMLWNLQLQLGLSGIQMLCVHVLMQINTFRIDLIKDSNGHVSCSDKTENK